MVIKLKELRESKDISLRQLAIETGISQGYLSDIEAGIKNNPSIDRICKLAKALGVAPQDLFECD